MMMTPGEKPLSTTLVQHARRTPFENNDTTTRGNISVTPGKRTRRLFRRLTFLVTATLSIGSLRTSAGFGSDRMLPHPQPTIGMIKQRTCTSGGGFSSGKRNKAQHLASSYSSEPSDEYSRCLSPKEEREAIFREVTYSEMDDENSNVPRPWWHRRLVQPVTQLGKSIAKLKKRRSKPGTLILMKCGDSDWRQNYTFTGWADPNLSPVGKQECEHAARLLLEAGYLPDRIYTSRLRRAIYSVWVVLQELNAAYLPVLKSWRLNERHYGAVQGMSKVQVAHEFGPDVVQAWRHSLTATPPPVTLDSPHYPANAAHGQYADLRPDQIPRSESLQDCLDRVRPLWQHRIARDLSHGETVLVMGHSNTLRGLAQIIENTTASIDNDPVFPPGIPAVYKFERTEDTDELKPIPVAADAYGEFLEKPGLLEEALKRQTEWKQSVPGFGSAAASWDDHINEESLNKRLSNVEQSLLKLQQEKTAEQWAGRLIVPKAHQQSEAIDVVLSTDDDERDADFEEDASHNPSHVIPNMDLMTSGSYNSEDPVVVLIRHGRTPHNQLALFTGWEDPPLTPAGVQDAIKAGQLLKRHNFTFDVVYSSWLVRAIETAWHVLDQLDLVWLPIVKSWRLNERHYGALTGKSKTMIGNIYGKEQLNSWRRGFDICPPPASSFSYEYPGNDLKRTKHVKDLRISWLETIFRSLEAREFQIHRKFPKTESLKMCMERSIPFYTQRIVPQAVNQGKRVLITSHENAIRGILMHLCEIPPEHMRELHLPNGLPLIYNVKRKCISLLDDGSGSDPMEMYDFGSAAQYLFRPCELTEDDFMPQQADERSPAAAAMALNEADENKKEVAESVSTTS